MTVVTDERTLQRNFEAAQERYKGTIKTFAFSFIRRLPEQEIEDLQQELLIVLWRCVRNYDPDRGASFNTLFQGCAQKHLIGMLRAADTQKRGKGKITKLDAEAFALAVEQSRTEGSAEDWYLAIAEHAEDFAAESAQAVA